MAVSFHMAERTLKSGSLKKFLKEVEESNINVFDYNYSMFREAVASGHFHIVRYLFLGELHTLYKPELMDSLVAHVRLSGRDVFNIPDLIDRVTSSDSPEIFEFVKAFNYKVLTSDRLDSILRLEKYKLLAHLLQTNQLSQELLSGVKLESMPFEALALLNSKFTVSLETKSYLFKHEDVRKRIFDKGEIKEIYSVETLLQSLHDENYTVTKEVLNHLEIEKGTHDRILNLVMHLDRGADILPDLLSRNIKPSNLKTFLQNFVGEYHPNRSGTLYKFIELLKDEVRPILMEDETLADMFLGKDVFWIDLLVKNQLIPVNYETAVKILFGREPSQIGRYFISLWSYGFPVTEINLKDFSTGQAHELKPLKSYFSRMDSNLFENHKQLVTQA